MKSFKELMQDDLSIFFNTNEFAETAVINGIEVPVIEDEAKLEQLKVKNVEGFEQIELLIYVKVSDLNFEPSVGTRINYNNRRYEVDQMPSKDFGVYELKLRSL